MDSLPPPPAALSAPAPPTSAAAGPPAPASGRAIDYGTAPGDIYPVDDHERALCREASRPDWLYLGGLVVLDAGAITADALDNLRNSSALPLRFVGPVTIGLTWGATVGGAWLALPKCSPAWIGETPREGSARVSWPLALSLAILAGATAPIVNAITSGYETSSPWSTLEREMHIVAAAVSGFGGALLPYVLPPRTWAAFRELDRLRFGADGRGLTVGYALAF